MAKETEKEEKKRIEKERKQWHEERQRKDAYVGQIQSQVLQLNNQISSLKEDYRQVQADLAVKEETESKVQSYV